MQTIVSTKVFENKGAVLRPFRAKDVETEGKLVGKALAMNGHPLSTQRSLLQGEFLTLMKHRLRGAQFSIRRASDVADLLLVLSGEKPASVIFYKGPAAQIPSGSTITIGNYAPIYAKLSQPLHGSRDLILSRDLSLIEKLDYILSIRAKEGKLSEEDFRAAGLAFGYPLSAVENHVASREGLGQMPQYARLLIENDITLTPALWNAKYIPTVSEGNILEIAHLERWNAALARELGPFYFDVFSAHNKLLKMELLTANLNGRVSWGEGARERAMREAIEAAYGVPLSVGY